MRPALFPFVLYLFAALGGCGGFDQLDAIQSQPASGGAAPQLVPIEGLIAQAGPGRATASARDNVAGRAAGLRARAKAMRGPVHSPATRARLAAAVAAHPTQAN
ncbi:hypothetical protein EOK75_12455 (plasmid) [Pseudorhodobacter turbinis]|uniref:Uncharacterized protein n=1 Tax=Pseudorhodobacter turbinis TaxID=2500533 RepID=A0A4P8EIH3_9RHOB|nr:hypothetical protein [Pseudorhodobacter turbinis]QCO56632.1 hypothetical protein EOK75_12455 [Pseudorhodobacter turbinis]